MLKKKISILVILVLFVLCLIFLAPHDKTYKILEVKSPKHLVLENGDFIFEDLDCFDSVFTSHNKELASHLNISETEAFVLGNLGKDYVENLLKGRSVYLKNDDLVYYRYGYKDRFFYSGYCFKDLEPCSKDAFEYRLKGIRRANYKVLDMDTELVYDLEDNKIRELDNFIVIRKSHIRKEKPKKVEQTSPPNVMKSGNIKIYFSDMTTKLKPDRNCSSDICKEILANINQAESTIDMAIYGYSRVPAIEKAFENAIKRGVKIRLVYDLDSQGKIFMKIQAG